MIDLLRSVRLKLIGIRHVGDFCRSLHFRSAIRRLTVSRCLDAGCGHGWYSRYLLTKRAAHVDACDIEEALLQQLQKQTMSRSLNTYVADLVTAKHSSDHDLSVCIDVLEHIPDYKSVLRNLANALQPGGHLFVHTPRDVHRTYVGVEVDNPLHVREGFSIQELTDACRENDLHVVDSKCTFGPLASIAWELEMKWGHGSALERAVLSLSLPLLKFMIWIDALADHSAGNGVYILAVKGSTDPSSKSA